MAHPDNIETRVSALETKVHDLAERVRHSEQDAAAARVLAGGADRDVAEIRGEIREFREQNTRVLNAMREDLTDIRQQVNDGFAEVNRGFVEIRGRLDATAAGQQYITDLLTRLIDQPSVE
jgi:hypothetical protein